MQILNQSHFLIELLNGKTKQNIQLFKELFYKIKHFWSFKF